MASNGNKFWLKFLAGIGIVLLGFAVGYGMLCQRVEENSKKVNENSEKIIQVDRALAEQGVNIEYIKKAVDEIRKEIKNGN